jgi:hypothetical protein
MLNHRQIKGNGEASKIYLTKVESMMDRDPPIQFGLFVQGLTRKFEEVQAEAAQDAALHAEAKQGSAHKSNENESTKLTSGKGERKGGKGRGGRGHGKTFGKGQHDSRIGALYYGKGGYDPDSWESHDQPFHCGVIVVAIAITVAEAMSLEVKVEVVEDLRGVIITPAI